MNTLSKGTLVEICPYRKGFSHDYLGHLDGERGEVQSVSGYGDELKVLVKIEGSLGPVEFPARALRPVEA